MSKYDWYIWPSYILAVVCLSLHVLHACNKAKRQLLHLRRQHGDLHDKHPEA